MKKIEEIDLIGEVKNYICEAMLMGTADQSIEADESLLQRGVLDSTGVLELVEFLQDRFGISVDDDEITPENMDSLNSIAAYLRRKLAIS